MSYLIDVCERKHKRNEASIAANKKAEAGKATWRQLIVGYAGIMGEFTSKEFARDFDKQLHTISGRIADLKRAGVLETTGARRDDCDVLRLKK